MKTVTSSLISTSNKDQLEAIEMACAWLSDELTSAGVAGIDDIVFAASQICAGRDPWAVARLVVEDVRNGVRYEPGIDLADKLVTGQLDGRFGPGMDLVTPEGIEKVLNNFGATSVPELVVKLMKSYGVTDVEELKACLDAEVSGMAKHFK